jgi:23S rRNA (guanosine2251-2'-O)-methyltransferase
MKQRKGNRQRQGKRDATREERVRDAQSGRARDLRNEHARETPGERVSRAFASKRGRASNVEGKRSSNVEGKRDSDPARLRQTIFENERASRVSVEDVHVGSSERFESNTTDAHVFGVQPVLEALRARTRPVERLLIAEGAHEARLHEIFELARASGIPIRRAPRAELQRLAPWSNHQGVVASIAAARYADAGRLLDALAARTGTIEPPLAVVLDGVEDPRNLGAIIRTVECAGAHGLFIPERRAAGLTDTVAKAAAGALEYVPVARAANLSRLLDELKARGLWTVGTAANANTAYTAWDWTQPCALLLGGEGAGLRRLVRERCDVLVGIPVRGRIDSLNVSVAAGIILYEAMRQRTARQPEAYNENQNAG